ncbi:MAG: hypothetical protein KatS3mg102_0753 [Planctomycetota bacterium]|nr:MAG: hypothetical protein KatS3mg102_0753 [Planctomycetota bacterium]
MCSAAESLGPYLDGELEPAARAAVEQALERCARCRRELQRLERLERLGRDLLAPPPVEPAEWERRAAALRQALAVAAPGAAGAAPPLARILRAAPAVRAPRMLLGGLVAAAAVVLVALIGIGLVAGSGEMSAWSGAIAYREAPGANEVRDLELFVDERYGYVADVLYPSDDSEPVVIFVHKL